MSHDYGPIQTYETVWHSGHVERIQAHQVTWPGQGMAMAASLGLVTTKGDERRPRVHFHGQIGGNWLLVLDALEEDLRTVRLITQDEPIPGGAS